ncbi:two-component system activity regulator YycH [Aquibacillus sp. 3ASR75-11]|uniref:Two-component system activity regulator YycH n=1 Tax=Terrihalobacillus insolitus TaxID=2950438 RepID=A0A9X3WWS4_9BACI|nr:two-component system activity regulator YycH [Terrihalobacillus insolitus]MDC3415059.1 two-component system activity regulator YycH [Terrihalobacillus insolitus]MDC3425973.1 two-component system activity regulator YycH [Terrihalobacillus insolitus]
MKLETVKSFVLLGLVGLSLLLTLAIWTYQPKYETLDERSYINDTKLNGKEEAIKTIIEPLAIMFHYNDADYGFKSKSEEKKLYQAMQEWSLYEFNQQSGEGVPDTKEKVEVIFPEMLPTEVIGSLFKVENSDSLPNGSFDRIYILLNDQTNIEIQFYNTSSDQKVVANIQRTNVYDQLKEYMGDDTLLKPYLVYENNSDIPIYYPQGEIEMFRSTIQARQIDQEPLKNALFIDPTLVKQNPLGDGAISYNDTTRQMKISPNGKSMEFTNPSNTEDFQMAPIQVITASLDFVNDHKGWTDEYNFFEMSQNQITYRLFYNGMPVFDSNRLGDLTTIQLRNQDEFQYNRPMFSLKTRVGSKEGIEELDSDDVSEFLAKTNTNVQGITIGYKISEQPYNIFSLEPAWYIKTNNKWKELDELVIKKGGREDALGTS